jgi:rubrerythrin
VSPPKQWMHQFTAKPERRLLSRLESLVAEENKDRNADRDRIHLHASEMSKNDWCPRASVYRMTHVPESDPDNLSLRRLNVFTEGHAIHDKWQRWMYKAGGLAGLFRCPECRWTWYDRSPFECPECGHHGMMDYREVPLRDDERLIMGHADGEWWDKHGMALVEIKSIGLGTLRWDAPNLYEGYESGDMSLDDLWKRIKRPLLPHRRQISLYLHMRGLTNAIVLYEWKPDQDVREFHVRKEEELIAPLLDKAEQVVHAVSVGALPPRPVEATHKSSEFCRFCPFKTECWGSRKEGFKS